MIGRQPHEDFFERGMFPPIGSLLMQCNGFVNLQAGVAQQIKQAVHVVCLVAYWEDVSVCPRIQCMDNPQARFLWQHFGGNSVPKNSIVQQIGSHHNECTSGAEAMGDLSKGFLWPVEMLDNHVTGDQIEAIFGKG